MKRYFLPLLLFGILFTSCSKDDINGDTNADGPDLEVKSFIHRAMADWYLYEAEVPELQEDFFDNDQEKKDFLALYDTPEEVFEKLQPSHDRFSFMWDDYTELEKLLYSGVEKTSGMVYGWGRIGDGDDIYILTRYVLPNSSADEAGIKRGDMFLEVDGIQLTRHNVSDLMSQDSFTISYAEISGSTIGLNGNTARLTGAEIAENPVHIAKVIEHDGLKVGYLLYNGFTSDFDPQLNEAFGYFKSQNIDELVIDLRYNGGGSVETASDLASMITGGFEGEILAEMIMNKKWKAIYEKEAPEYVNFRFNNKIKTGEEINSLNLGKVFVIATFGSASASELLINGLDPYMEVVHIGSNTAGKYQSSRTLYDSDHVMFYKQNVNPSHKYALQPLISKIANANGRTDYEDGLTPDIQAAEGSNYQPLGEPDEPLLRVALNAISGVDQGDAATGTSKHMVNDQFKIEGSSEMFKPTYQRMYTNEFPFPEIN